MSPNTADANPAADAMNRPYRSQAELIRLVFFPLLLCLTLRGQEQPAKKLPSITMTPAPLSVLKRAQPGMIDLHFHVAGGFHVNSHTPSEEFLIPTALKLDVPTDVVVEEVAYPDGEQMSFAFAPDQKLSVYTGDFAVGVVLHPLPSVALGKYMVHGRLKYQACDNAACYPPKQLPVEFEVQVVKGTPAVPRRNPAQSPHIHN